MADNPLPTTPTELPTGGMRAILNRLGAPDAYGNPAPSYTGCLHVRHDTDDREGAIYLRAGRVYAFTLTGFIPAVAARLRSAGLLSADVYDYLAALDPTEVSAVAVERGYVDADAIEDVHRQMLIATITHLYGWENAHWWWEDGADSSEFTIAGLEVSLVVVAADERIGQWTALSRNFPAVTKSNAIPKPGPAWAVKAGESTTPEIAAILTHVTGEATLADIATTCGFTRFEIAARLAKAIADGILIVDDPAAITPTVEHQFFAVDSDDDAATELEDALEAVEQARANLAAAEARVIRAQQVADQIAAQPAGPRRPTL